MPFDEPIALAHDYLLVLRGAERTFAAMADAYPGAPIATTLHDRAGTQGRFAGHPIRTSRLQRLGIGQRGFRRLLPVLPAAAERLDTARAELLLSSSSAFAHAAPKASGATHVCYCHSPFRYIWHERRRGRSEVPVPARHAFDALSMWLRHWDVRAAQDVDVLLANSRITQERIADFWGLPSTVLHPPVETGRMRIGQREDFVLSVGELVAHKGTERTLRAARRVGRKVMVVGTGPDHERLASLYGDVASFAGRVGDAQLEELYARANAFVMPNVEEFGIAAVEAQAAGRPVIAAAAGGALETVEDGRTGLLVPVDDEDALAEALDAVDSTPFDPQYIADRAERFSTEAFTRALTGIVDAARGRERPRR